MLPRSNTPRPHHTTNTNTNNHSTNQQHSNHIPPPTRPPRTRHHHFTNSQSLYTTTPFCLSFKNIHREISKTCTFPVRVFLTRAGLAVHEIKADTHCGTTILPGKLVYRTLESNSYEGRYNHSTNLSAETSTPEYRPYTETIPGSNRLPSPVSTNP
ncbi:hypothetical protein SCIP_0016 [Scardovia inopinata JCM 12537]|nr:hypothetical protein SCIP_0016 [Scardovia inopinata JCM 12537]